jgi:hypothetical protein
MSLLLLNGVQALADDGACSTASLINPNSMNGGMGGTGALAKGGMGGTGIDIGRGSIGGAGIPTERGGLGGTGVIAENTKLLPNDTQGGIAIMSKQLRFMTMVSQPN